MTRSRTLRAHFHWRFHLPARMLAQKHILHSQHPQFTKRQSRRRAWAPPCATGAPLAWGRHGFDAHQDGLHNCQNTPPRSRSQARLHRWLLVGHRVGGPGKISDIRFDRPRFAVRTQAITTADLGHSFRPAPLCRPGAGHHHGGSRTFVSTGPTEAGPLGRNECPRSAVAKQALVPGHGEPAPIHNGNTRHMRGCEPIFDRSKNPAQRLRKEPAGVSFLAASAVVDLAANVG